MVKHAHKIFESLQPLQDHVTDKITDFAGSIQFVYLHSVWFILWVILNLGLIGAGFVFDRYPFGLLTLVVSLEAIFLSTFVMISQNRQAKISELRSQLDYETNVKAEKEVEMIMETLERIAAQMRVDVSDLTQKIEALHREEDRLIDKEKTGRD